MKKYKSVYKEQKDLNELIGYLKAKYGDDKRLKQDKKFKELSDADKEYVLDELEI